MKKNLTCDLSSQQYSGLKNAISAHLEQLKRNIQLNLAEKLFQFDLRQAFSTLLLRCFALNMSHVIYKTCVSFQKNQKFM